ncbi:MAG: ABC-2 family transporter protein [Patescibacteria group bacterium]
MRYLRIFLIHFHRVIENRSRSVVWTLLSIFNPLVYLCFWFAVYKSSGKVVGDLSLSELASYYLLLTFAGSLLMAHIDESVAEEDIYEGGLVKYIVRPFSYFWDLYFGELGWRIFQGGLSIIVFVIFSYFLHSLSHFVSSPILILLTLLSIILAYTLSFIFRMILGFTAFWVTEFRGVQNVAETIILVFAGFVVPLQFLPVFMQKISYILPFAYMIYYPILAIQGKLDFSQMVKVLSTQAVWIVLLSLLYQYMWRKGLKLFTGVGQ